MPAEKILTRECALSRQTKPVDDLIRFALGPDGAIVPDVDGKAEGRGVWVTLSEIDGAGAGTRKVFPRSLKQNVTVPGDLALLTRARLEQRLLGALGLARKAGQLLTGATKVKAALHGGSAIALLTATDAAPDGQRKMLQARRASGEEAIVPHLRLLTSTQMGLALGQENVIHAALITGTAAKTALLRAQRLARFTAQPDE